MVIMATRGSIVLDVGVSTCHNRSMCCVWFLCTLLREEYVGSLILTEVRRIHTEQIVPIRNSQYILYQPRGFKSGIYIILLNHFMFYYIKQWS